MKINDKMELRETREESLAKRGGVKWLKEEEEAVNVMNER